MDRISILSYWLLTRPTPSIIRLWEITQMQGADLQDHIYLTEQEIWS